MTSQVNEKVFIAGDPTRLCSLINDIILLAAVLVAKQREQPHLDVNQLQVNEKLQTP